MLKNKQSYDIGCRQIDDWLNLHKIVRIDDKGNINLMPALTVSVGDTCHLRLVTFYLIAA